MWLKKGTQKYLSTFLDILWFRASFPWWDVRWCKRERLERERPTISRPHPSQLGEFLLPRSHPIYHRMMTITRCFLFFWWKLSSMSFQTMETLSTNVWVLTYFDLPTSPPFEVGIQGKKGLILSPAIYQVSTPIQITQPHFVILGLGFPTLVSMETCHRKQHHAKKWQILVSWENMRKNDNANFLQGITLLNVG